MRSEFSPAWLRQQCSVLQQRGSAALQRASGAAAASGSRGLRTVKDASKKTFDRLRATSWRAIARRYKASLLVLGGVLLAFFLLVTIIKVPQWQVASWQGQPGIERRDLSKLENDARTTLIQGLGGLVLLIGLYLTLRNLHLTHDRQITEHYTRAVEQLGSDRLSLRLGAIYALERIARDSKRDHWPIMEILTAYVREHASWDPAFTKRPTSAWQRPPADIEAVLTVLRQRTQSFGKGENQGLDLRRTDLTGANLRGAHLEKAQLWGAYLEEAELWDAHLEEAELWGADLKGAILTGAHLRGTGLGGAYLERTHLERAVDLTVEQLSEVNTLYEAHLDPSLKALIQEQYPRLLERVRS